MKRSLLMLAIVALCCVLPASAVASEASSEALIEDPSAWDGRVVTFTGEAIGEAMVRGDEVWLHLNDDAYADASVAAGSRPQGYNSGMAVVLDPEAAALITVFGDHRHQGDIVQVTGVFNAACPEHGGDMEIHASDMHIVRTGRELAGKLGPSSLIMLAASFVGAAIAMGVYAVRRSRD